MTKDQKYRYFYQPLAGIVIALFIGLLYWLFHL